MDRKRVSRRQFLKLSATVGAAGVLAACGGAVTPPAAEGPKPTSAPAAAEPTTAPAAAEPTTAPAAAEPAPTTAPAAGAPAEVRLLTTHGATMAPFIESSLAKFAEANPEVKVEWEDLTEGYYDRLNVQIASGTLPDVVNLRSFDMYDWYSRGNLHDVTSFLTSDPDVKPDDLVDAILQSCEFEGKYFGLPYDASVEILYYNKDMFDAAGVSYPTDTWTWDDQLAAAKKLTNAGEGNFGFARLPPYKDWQVEPWVLSNGGRMINEERTEWTMVGPEAEGTYQYLADLVKTEKVAPEPMAQSEINLFVVGKGAMYVSGQWEIPGNREAIKFNWDVAALPTGPKGHKPITHGGTYIMNAKTAVPEAAWKIQKWICAQPDWQSNVYGASGYSLPSLKKVSSEAWLAPIADGKAPANAKVVLSELEAAQSGSLWPNFQKIATIMSEELDRIFVEGLSVPDALAALKVRADEAIKEASPS